MAFYQEIMEGLQESLAIAQGKKKPARITRVAVNPPPEYLPADIRQIRAGLGLSQRSFAGLLGVSIKTVEAWESGVNRPGGAAARLLEIIKANPELVDRFYSREAV